MRETKEISSITLEKSQDDLIRLTRPQEWLKDPSLNLTTVSLTIDLGLRCPQLTVLNAGRKYLGLESLAGRVLVTSGLGGMSGAQAKAAVICGCIGVVAEVSVERGQPKPII